jgi:hypothetical protein
MSFWWYGKPENGKRYWWLIDTDPLAVLMLVLFVVAVISMHILNHPSIPFLLILSGLVCLIAAKISLFRRGIWFSFGSGLMSKGCARLYKAGYILMGFGVLLMLLLLSALRVLR